MQDSPDTPSKTAAGASDYINLTADLVSAYVSNNSIPMIELGSLLTSVHAALSGLTGGGSAAPAKEAVEKPTAAQIKKSITPEALISFEDGKPYKILRRHLGLYGLTPETYRVKHGLPVDYPMTAASYSTQRSELARSVGLGHLRKGARKASEPEETVSEAPKRRGRLAKAD